jgi:aldose 1-epimerase
VLEAACFPLVPYANRIADGRFTFGGRTAALSRNMAGQAHPLHGDGWRGAWRIEARGEDFVTLVFEPEATEWPWRYRARQIFRLRPDGLTVELGVSNLDDAPGPFGAGFHPYFPHSATARLTAQTRGVWRWSADLLPTELVAAAPWSDGAPVRTERLVDHCHTGWSGPARIDLGPGRPSLELTASPELGWLHVFAPPNQDFFCVEPVSHAPNALNMPAPEANGVRTLAPGETLGVWMRLDLM